MDQAAIETNGLTPVAGDLKRIATADTKAQIATLFGMPGFASLFDLDLPPDLKNPDRYSVVISQSSLGLPDRDYYLKDDPKLVEIRGKYVAYVEQMLTLGAVPEAAAKAKEIMAFETAVAKLQWPNREAPRRGCHLQPAHEEGASRVCAGVSRGRRFWRRPQWEAARISF